MVHNEHAKKESCTLKLKSKYSLKSFMCGSLAESAGIEGSLASVVFDALLLPPSPEVLRFGAIKATFLACEVAQNCGCWLVGCWWG